MPLYSQPSSPPLTPPAHDATGDDENATDASALSIRAICQQHPRQRFLVQPLHWTARQLELLGCTFSNQLCSQQRSSSPPPSPKQTSPLYASVVTLARGCLSPAKQDALAKMLASSPMALKKTSERLFFCYESHTIRMLCAVFSSRPPSHPTSAGIPTIAYLDRGSLRNDRKASLDYIRIPHPTRRPSRATASLYSIHLARIMPSDPARDPYVAALLIALAQSQRRNLKRTSGTATANPTSFEVHVFLGDVSDQTRFLVYTADIPVAALDRLADSRWAPRTPTHFVVHTTEVPFQPYPTFPQRLLQATFPKVALSGRKRRRASETSPIESFKVARVG